MSDLQEDVEAIEQINIVPSLLNVICSSTGMGFAAVARVTENRWITCSVYDEIAFGLKVGDELKVETTLCHEVRQFSEPVIIDHVDKDELYCKHHTPAMYGFQSYISVPIFRKDGSFFGTLCSIDPNPAQLKKPEVIAMFTHFAELNSFHLDTIDQLKDTGELLKQEKEMAELREHFIAILGHDLRNPVATTKSCVNLLLDLPLGKTEQRIVELLKGTNFRMERLIENMLDFARGKLGAGIHMSLEEQKEGLEAALLQVISEMRIMADKQEIHYDIQLDHTVLCDVARIAQLFSNLLGNALAHGSKKDPIKITALSDSSGFTLEVANQGNKIPETEMENLFQPFYQSDLKVGKKGLGLGLYIASEIAKAHKGEILVKSTDAQTSFSVQIPST